MAVLLAACQGTGLSSSFSSPSSSSEGSSSSSASSSSIEASSFSSETSLPIATLKAGNGHYPLDPKVTNVDSSLNYEIFVRSFYDAAGGDGIGDFAGVAAKGDYLKSLGVGSVWLMPIYPSPSYHGYDVKDYEDVNPDFGNLASFDAMVASLSGKGIGVILDMVLNHSSSQHPWFDASYLDYLASPYGPKADWYHWSVTGKGPNYHRYKDLYFEGDFGSNMPDLNLDSASLRAEIKNILLFWLDRGVSGFRLDAVRYFYLGDTDKNVAFLTTLVDDVHEAYPTCYFVGENWTSGADYYAYYASKINSFFAFDESITSATPGSLIGTAKRVDTGNMFTAAIQSAQSLAKAKNPASYNSFFLSNHDQDRSSKSLQGNDAKLAANLTYLLPGTPYVYYGEEIGLWGVRGQNDNNDVLRRLPMVWSKTDQTGKCRFPDPSAAWLQPTAEQHQVTLGAEDLLADPQSLIAHYQMVANVRNRYHAIRDASFLALRAATNTFAAYTLEGGDEKVAVVTNTGVSTAAIDVSSYGSAILESIDTVNLIPDLTDGILTLGGFSTAILRCP